jgi:hypothetical protein
MPQIFRETARRKGKPRLRLAAATSSSGEGSHGRRNNPSVHRFAAPCQRRRAPPPRRLGSFRRALAHTLATTILFIAFPVLSSMFATSEIRLRQPRRASRTDATRVKVKWKRFFQGFLTIFSTFFSGRPQRRTTLRLPEQPFTIKAAAPKGTTALALLRKNVPNQRGA